MSWGCSVHAPRSFARPLAGSGGEGDGVVLLHLVYFQLGLPAGFVFFVFLQVFALESGRGRKANFAAA